MSTVPASCRLAALGLALGLGACSAPSGGGAYCNQDFDCSGGDVCAHTHECLAPDQVHSVVIRWTIGGAAPDATTCNGISQLEVGYQIGFDPSTAEVFAPVACAEASFPNDKWPIAFDTAVVIADAPGNQTVQTTPIPADPMADVTVDVAHP